MGSSFSSGAQVSQPPPENNSTVKLRISQPPPENNSTKLEKCYDCRDSTLQFVDGDDDLDVEYVGYKSLRAAMSCGHAVTPMSLTKYCRWLLDEGRQRFVCPVDDCDKEWNYGEVRKMALLTAEERQYFEEKMTLGTKLYSETKSCPGCKSLVMREDVSNLCVRCTVCSTVNRKSYKFCWQCLREWKGPYPRLDRCDNDGCYDRDLEILKNCKEITFKSVRDVTGCPSVRACPTCGFLVQHDTTMCKSITCSRCKVEFCFVCLKLTKECLKLRDTCYFVSCYSGVAPRQTSIPVWNSK
ncbi:uncharacterized protein LOC143008618 [Genypterus blacodes]|uniref:uncharacterized protein LOC143008618 n=1 Tax=Genypterus blacodes TaxID=154954 RepID=UPI003F75FD90